MKHNALTISAFAPRSREAMPTATALREHERDFTSLAERLDRRNKRAEAVVEAVCHFEVAVPTLRMIQDQNAVPVTAVQPEEASWEPMEQPVCYRPPLSLGTVRVALAGCGVVGSALVRLMEEHRDSGRPRGDPRLDLVRVLSRPRLALARTIARRRHRADRARSLGKNRHGHAATLIRAQPAVTTL